VQQPADGRSSCVAFGVKRTSTRAGHRTGFMNTPPNYSPALRLSTARHRRTWRCPLVLLPFAVWPWLPVAGKAVSLGGRPKRTPLAIALLRPSPVLALISSRSNSGLWLACALSDFAPEAVSIAASNIDPINKRIGTRRSFGAVYTSPSVGRKQAQWWRELQKVRKRL
jgi:hypothetical protein